MTRTFQRPHPRSHSHSARYAKRNQAECILLSGIQLLFGLFFPSILKLLFVCSEGSISKISKEPLRDSQLQPEATVNKWIIGVLPNVGERQTWIRNYRYSLGREHGKRIILSLSFHTNGMHSRNQPMHFTCYVYRGCNFKDIHFTFIQIVSPIFLILMKSYFVPEMFIHNSVLNRRNLKGTFI